MDQLKKIWESLPLPNDELGPILQFIERYKSDFSGIKYDIEHIHDTLHHYAPPYLDIIDNINNITRKVTSRKKYDVRKLHDILQHYEPPYYELKTVINEKRVTIYFDYRDEYKKLYLFLYLINFLPSADLVNYLLQHGLNDRSLYIQQFWIHYVVSLEPLSTVVEVMKNHKDMIESKNGYLNTPLYTAIERGDVSIVKALIDLGANVNSMNVYNEYLLHLAVKLENIQIVETLIEHQADVNVGNKNGKSPLIYAVLTHDLAILKLLLKHGADVNLLDKQEKSALHYAIRDNLTSIIVELMLSNANVEMLDLDGLAPLDYADRQWKSGNIYLFETVIKCSAFMKVNLEECAFISLNCDLPVKRDLRYNPEMYELFLTCKDEVNKMNSCFLEENYTLYDFVKDLIKSKFSKQSHIIQLLTHLVNKKYPVFYDLIFGLLTKENVINVFSNIFISVSTGNNGEIVALNYDSKMSLVKYLTKCELVSFVIAFVS